VSDGAKETYETAAAFTIFSTQRFQPCLEIAGFFANPFLRGLADVQFMENSAAHGCVFADGFDRHVYVWMCVANGDPVPVVPRLANVICACLPRHSGLVNIPGGRRKRRRLTTKSQYRSLRSSCANLRRAQRSRHICAIKVVQ